MLVIGFAAGAISLLGVYRLLLRNVGAVGVAFGAFLDLDAALMPRQAASLNQMIIERILRP